ncbi:MAG: ATP-binding protein [Kofleriaceae bacterium]
MQWLVRLRWAQLVGQIATVVGVELGFDLPLPLAPLAIVIGLGVASNLALEAYVYGARRDGAARPVPDGHLAGVMALDVALLTVLLGLTGGPHNPFGFLYLVQIALAAVLLRAAWTWALVALSFIGYGVLLGAHRALPISDDARLVGVWVALGVAAGFIVHFLQRITGALAEREAELALARNLSARQERLASLATMAAGAAHELATPLSTVALVAKELERHLVAAGDAPLVEDARLIREQVGRCRVILDQMAGGAGTIGEGVAVLTVDALLAESLTSVRHEPVVRREVAAEVAATPVRLPPRAVSQALRSLVTNAQDAAGPSATVTVGAELTGADDDRRLRITIVDRGPGMTPEVLARVGEPFYTPKAPGRGMGLGLYLARAVIEGVGGTMIIESTVGQGTRIAVIIPVEVGPESVRTGETNPGPVLSKEA